MKTTIEVDTRGFQSYIRDLSRIAGKAPEKVLPIQVGRVLSTAVRHTKKATLKKLLEGAEKRTERNYNTYAKGDPRNRGAGKETPYISITKKGVWWIDRNQKGKRTSYKMDDPQRRWSDARWKAFVGEDKQREEDLKVALTKAKEAARKSRGLAAQAWVEIGELLGIPVQAPAYVKKARPSNGRTYDNAIGKKGQQGTTHYFDIGTRQPILVKRIDGAGVLKRAITTTMTAFEKDIRYGVFQDAQRAAARYPGIFVKP